MRVACIRYKSYEDEKNSKKINTFNLQFIQKKNDLITLPGCATFLNINKSDAMINARFKRNSFSLKIIKEIAKNLDVNISIGTL